MSEHPDPPPEGALIKAALERKRPKLSVRAAAPLAGIGEARWRQIVKGYVTMSGTDVPVIGPPDTVARMARVVGVTPEQLEEAGRQDAAEELRALPPPAREPEDLSKLTDAELRARLDEMGRRLARLEEKDREREQEERRESSG